MANKGATTKILVSIGTEIRLHILTAKTSFPIQGSLEDISGTDQGGR